MKISVIIPNYNGEHLLSVCLAHLQSVIRESKEIEVIVVDDASTDESVHLLSQNVWLQKYGKVVQRSKNGGFSSCVNSGVKQASGDILVLLNTDVLLKENIFFKVREHFTNKDVFAVGFRDETYENGEKRYHGRGIGKWQRGFLHHAKGNIKKSNTLWASGGSSAFKKDIWQKLGGLYEVYNPFYWEDIDLSYRALKSGYTVIFDKHIIVEHNHTQGTIRSNYTVSQVKKIAYRNQFLFVWLNITERSFLISHLFWLPYHLISSFLRNDGAFLKGFIAAFGKLPAIFSLRKKNIKNFSLSDTSILSLFSS